MPVNPDLNLSMSIEYDGSQEFKTSDGSTITQLNYNGSPWWYDNLGKKREPWAIGSEELASYSSNIVKRSGRRTWDLSFSYLDDGDVFGANQYLGRLEWGNQTDIIHADDVDDNEYYADNLLTNDNFFSQVIHKTNGGQLPFIFQPDENDFTQFSICKFDQNSFKFKQVANGVYNVNLKIREVW